MEEEDRMTTEEINATLARVEGKVSHDKTPTIDETKVLLACIAGLLEDAAKDAEHTREMNAKLAVLPQGNIFGIPMVMNGRRLLSYSVTYEGDGDK